MKQPVAFALVLCASFSALFFGVSAFKGSAATPAPIAAAMTDMSPTAMQFTRAFVGSANQLAGGHTVANPHCVKAAPSKYMCAYAIVTSRGLECHLMQATWTPEAASTITVTLSGRVGRCGSIREAVHSLG